MLLQESAQGPSNRSTFACRPKPVFSCRSADEAKAVIMPSGDTSYESTTRDKVATSKPFQKQKKELFWRFCVFEASPFSINHESFYPPSDLPPSLNTGIRLLIFCFLDPELLGLSRLFFTDNRFKYYLSFYRRTQGKFFFFFLFTSKKCDCVCVIACAGRLCFCSRMFVCVLFSYR